MFQRSLVNKLLVFILYEKYLMHSWAWVWIDGNLRRRTSICLTMAPKDLEQLFSSQLYI